MLVCHCARFTSCLSNCKTRNCTIVGNKRTWNDESCRGIWPMLLSEVVKILNNFHTVHKELKASRKTRQSCFLYLNRWHFHRKLRTKKGGCVSVNLDCTFESNPICIQLRNLQFRVCWWLGFGKVADSCDKEEIREGEGNHPEYTHAHVSLR